MNATLFLNSLIAGIGVVLIVGAFRRWR